MKCNGYKIVKKLNVKMKVVKKHNYVDGNVKHVIKIYVLNVLNYQQMVNVH
jgi:hypothetical protein